MIRRVESSDAAGVYAVERTCFPDPYPSAFIEDLMAIQRHRFFVAVENRKIIGYAVGTSQGRGGHIVSVAVDPHHRRQGIGRALMWSLMQQLLQDGINEIQLEVRKGNMAGLLFHKTMGFRISSEIKHYYPDGEDAWVLKAPIETPSDR